MSSQVSTDHRARALDAWAALLRGNAAARRALSAELDARHGLTVSAFEALQLLEHAERNALRRIDLANGLGLTASGVTRLLEGLERDGYVGRQRCETDGRATYAVLTDAGREKLAEASCSHVAAVAAFLEERYSPEELAVLENLLSRLSCREYAA